MWQHVKLSEQIRPCDTLACCWDVKQPTNKQTNFCGVLAFLSATCVVGWQSSVVDVDLFQVLLCVSRCLTDRPLSCVTQIDYRMGLLVGWLVACFMSQQHPGASQGRICSNKCTCRHTDAEVTNQTFYLTQPQNTDTGPTIPSVDPITPGAWQDSHWSANF